VTQPEPSCPRCGTRQTDWSLCRVCAEKNPRTCIRGCTHTTRDPTTRAVTGEQPRPATTGLLCTRCADKLHQAITEIPDQIAELDLTPQAGASTIAGTRHGKLSGSPALIRLDAQAMIDPRAVAYDRLEPGQKPHPNRVRFGGDVPGVIISWADNLCDDLNLTNRPTTLTTAAELLTTWFTDLTQRPWIAEFYNETLEIRGALRGINGVTDPRTLGKCQCGRTIYEPSTVVGTLEPTSAFIECKCGHRVNALALTRIAEAGHIENATVARDHNP
jgi:hypothetical protein